MRQKASELVKGEWYADIKTNVCNFPVFLKYSHSNGNLDLFSDQKGSDKYKVDTFGMIGFYVGVSNYYIPTPEDIEKYNLNEKE